MSYFRELPDLEYQSPFVDSNSSQNYIRAKNLFRRVKLRDDLHNVFTLFNKYQITEGARPDTIAEEIYGKADYDWVVLLTAGIVNVRDEWPLSNRDLYRYVENVYGNDLNAIHHYETTEVKDSNGRLILPAGKVVDSNFRSPRPEDGEEESPGSYVKYYDSVSGAYVTEYNITIGISNYEYETIKNEEKRSIYLLKKEYLQQYLNDMRTIMYYEKSSQYIDKTLIRTENTRVTMP
jgi:hypothetical protein